MTDQFLCNVYISQIVSFFIEVLYLQNQLDYHMVVFTKFPFSFKLSNGLVVLIAE